MEYEINCVANMDRDCSDNGGAGDCDEKNTHELPAHARGRGWNVCPLELKKLLLNANVVIRLRWIPRGGTTGKLGEIRLTIVERLGETLFAKRVEPGSNQLEEVAVVLCHGIDDVFPERGMVPPVLAKGQPQLGRLARRCEEHFEACLQQ